MNIPLGPIMGDVKGLELDAEEREIFVHPSFGGVVLFARNYQSKAQLKALTTSIRSLRTPQLLIAVDHEGGRVQRFRDGFTLLPPMSALGSMWGTQQLALDAAHAVGIVMGSELKECGIDFSFAPVLDIDHGSSSIIGNRAFSSDSGVVAELAGALVAGLSFCGMAAVGKHFPGHGFVRADSHLAIPVDERSAESLEADIAPFRALAKGKLAGVMPAHVIYPAFDSRPAGFSPIWLGDILRRQLGFQGMIFSDDLTMEGASFAGDMANRADAAFTAGCDMALVCNSPELTRKLLATMSPRVLNPSRAEMMRSKPARIEQAMYQAARQKVLAIPA